MSLPFVSICTPTFNRRPFIPYAIKCFLQQDYPKDKMEWIIVDDGTDPIEDLISSIPQVKYFYLKERMLLGKKRNYMHSKCKGDIIVYMDDDDYYPVERVSHSVKTLLDNPNYLIAGSSEMHIYFDSRGELYCCGPYKENHATAATFAFKKSLLNQTKFDNSHSMSEEASFLKNYTIPLIQLDTLKTILVFSHKHNSLNKEKILEKPEQFKVKKSRFTVDDFIKDPILKEFYMVKMNDLLTNYSQGVPENKPEVLRDIKKGEEKREQKLKELELKQQLYNSFTNKSSNLNIANTNNTINNNYIIEEYKKKIEDKNCLINELLKKIKLLTIENNELKNKLLEK
jgi:glycosyltransferase involved in cell wall biosynthesis